MSGAGGSQVARWRPLCLAVLVVALARAWSPGIAQHTHPHTPAVSGMPHGIPLLCAEPTVSSVASGAWSDPATWSTRRVPGPNDRVAIPAGRAVTYDTSSEAALDCVEVRGRLAFAATSSTRLIAGTLMVLEGGTLEVGRADQPIGLEATAEIVIADRPIDPVRDPGQVGTGLVALGTVRMHGSAKTPTFLRTRSEPLAGDARLELDAPVDTWRPGDELVIPDTRQLRAAERGGGYRPQTERVRIASVSGQAVTLAAPLAFSHKGAGGNRVEFTPHVGNLTRNVIVRSASPKGTRGHTMFMSRADVDLRYVEFRDLGRTTTAGLDNTQFDSEGRALRIGRNQIGRYALHFHHAFGPTRPQANGHQFTVIGNAVHGAAKWGIAVHRSHYGLVQDNVVFDTRGGGIVTEDGSESFNVFDHNLSIQSVAGRGASADPGYASGVEVGGDGAGFWFRGPNNHVRSNVAAGGETLGFALPAASLGTVRVPAFKGADTSRAVDSVQVDMAETPLLEFAGNEAYGAMQTGLLSVWNGTIAGLTVWHASQHGVSASPPDRLVVSGLTVRGDRSALASPAEKPVGVWISNYLSKDVRLIDADVQGMRVGVLSPFFYDQTPKPGRGAGSLLVEDGFFRNQIGISVATAYSAGAGASPVKHAVVRRSRFAPLEVPGGDEAPRSEAISMNYDMPPRDPRPRDPLLVYDYNRQPGNDFKVYYSRQAPETAAPCHDNMEGIGGWVCR
jgi:hypothetical protein